MHKSKAGTSLISFPLNVIEYVNDWNLKKTVIPEATLTTGDDVDVVIDIFETSRRSLSTYV